MAKDAGVAALLAGALGAVWTLRGWPALSMLHLPDTDDVMRLQQVRDWIDGQAFRDVAQHRLGTGLEMHWSRLADLVPAAGIVGLTPLFGRHAAELATVIVWPLLLFAAALSLVARIARALTAPASTATLVAAIAYPTTTVFLPGRIDHHGLQVVFLLGAVLALLGSPTRARGAAIGLAAAASMAVGLETAPLFLAIGGVVVAAWIADAPGARNRLIGLAIGAGAGLCAARGVFASDAFAYPACDGFTLDAWRAGMIGSAGMLVLAGLPRAAIPTRLVAAGLVGGATVLAAIVVVPRCLSPYGAVDPALARIWLAHVAEAQSLFAADPGVAIGYVGLSVTGIAATLSQVRTKAPGWTALLVVQIAAFAITTVQLRGAYAGAMLAAPSLAVTIAAARRAGGLRLAAAWLVSAGMLYPIAAQALPVRRAVPPRAAPRGDCASAALLSRLAALPPGTVMAPIDAGAYAIGATRHRLIAAPYHRNGPGNLAMFAFYGGGPVRAMAIARHWHVDYVVACADMPAGAMASAIAHGPVPGVATIAALPDGARLLRVR
ncbi:hypothetical protein [uncultured Sphingomonas sp.]|uniref:hypothetical protein n=1 Tax=uncultured Sphingomonas sp. TaxID=158754 RepID=UPI0035CC18F4